MPVSGVSSQHPLVEIINSAYELSKDVTWEKVQSLIFHAPQLYWQWWQSVYQDSPLHVLIETGLICFIVWLLFIRTTVDPKKTSKGKHKLKPEEEEWLIETWQPEPLVPKLTTDAQKSLAHNTKVIEGCNGKYINIRGVDKDVLNMSSFDFYGFAGDKTIKEVATQNLEKYGCGSCGPRGFYGTIDQHLFFEDAISKFMNTQEAISYSDGASVVTSSIPAFSKRGDLLIIDDACNESILTGANLSRSTVQFFKHNDMDDLHSILQSIADEDRKKRRDATQQRRFIVVEGLYRNTGDLCKLPEIVALKSKYCYRLIVDESLSFGTIGKTGRGVSEHFGIDPNSVDILDIAMDTSLGSIGGVCVGTREVVDHQRLSGAGYCFSASMPPFLAACATKSLEILANNSAMVTSLQANCQVFVNALKSLESVGITRLTKDVTPIQHLLLDCDKDVEEMATVQLANECVKRGVGVCYSNFVLAKTNPNANLRPTIRVTLTALISEQDMKNTVNVIAEAWKAVKAEL